MNKLSKEQLKAREEAVENLNKAAELFRTAVEVYNDELKIAWSGLETARITFNEAIEEANAFRQSMLDDMQNFYDEKSEKWQEGDKGQAYQSWMDYWSNEFDQISDIDEPDEFEEEIPDGSIFYDLNEAPE